MCPAQNLTNRPGKVVFKMEKACSLYETLWTVTQVGSVPKEIKNTTVLRMNRASPQTPDTQAHPCICNPSFPITPYSVSHFLLTPSPTVPLGAVIPQACSFTILLLWATPGQLRPGSLWLPAQDGQPLALSQLAHRLGNLCLRLRLSLTADQPLCQLLLADCPHVTVFTCCCLTGTDDAKIKQICPHPRHPSPILQTVAWGLKNLLPYLSSRRLTVPNLSFVRQNICQPHTCLPSQGKLE